MHRDDSAACNTVRHYDPALLQQSNASADDRQHGGITHRDDDIRPNAGKLCFEPRLARCNLSLARRLVDAHLPTLFKPKMLYGTRDVNIFAFQPGIGQRAIEQLPGRPDERLPFPVLVVSRLLAYKHNPGIVRTKPKHRLRCMLPKIASATLMRQRRAAPAVIRLRE